MTLIPTTKQSRDALDVSPLDVRVLLAGMPKVGKSTLAASWPADTTLIVDTQRGSTMLDGDHFVAHVGSWAEFEALVTELTMTEHQFRTVVLDLVDDLWRFCDVHHAGKDEVLASATDDWQRSINTCEGVFIDVVGRLIGSPLGIWFLTHTTEKKDGDLTRYVPALSKRPLGYVKGVCQVILLAETLGTKRMLHTQPSARFEAGSRLPLPEPMPMDAAKLYRAMGAALPNGVARDLAERDARRSPEPAPAPPADEPELEGADAEPVETPAGEAVAA